MILCTIDTTLRYHREEMKEDRARIVALIPFRNFEKEGISDRY